MTLTAVPKKIGLMPLFLNFYMRKLKKREAKKCILNLGQIGTKFPTLGSSILPIVLELSWFPKKRIFADTIFWIHLVLIWRWQKIEKIRHTTRTILKIKMCIIALSCKAVFIVLTSKMIQTRKMRSHWNLCRLFEVFSRH